MNIKSIFASFLMAIAICSTTMAQDKISSSKIIGQWKMNLEIEELIEEAADELDADESFEKVLLKSIGGFVGGIMDEVDIFLDFQKNGTVEIVIHSFDEVDSSHTDWEIRNNRLYISDNEDISTDIGNYWELTSGILVCIDDEDNLRNKITLTKMK